MHKIPFAALTLFIFLGLLAGLSFFIKNYDVGMAALFFIYPIFIFGFIVSLYDVFLLIRSIKKRAKREIIWNIAAILIISAIINRVSSLW